MMLFATIFLLIVLLGILGFVDRRTRRSAGERPALTFVIPCFNDAATIHETLASIRSIAEPQDSVIVVDDGSAESCRMRLQELAAIFDFKLILNAENRGKAIALNECAAEVRTELIAFVDADVAINRAAFDDALERIADTSVGAVSCPFRPINRGMIPLMQQIEYNVMRFVHGSYNLVSAIAMWGGFVLIKREAFLAVGGYSSDAIVEDKDLAFKLNRSGWRVQQSFCCMDTYVPDTLRTWLKQKIRWSSGGAQCYLRHWKVWVRNPLHMLFLSMYFGAFGVRIWEAFDGMALWESVFAYFDRVDETLTFAESFRSTYLVYGPPIRAEVFEGAAYTALSLPFVLPLLSTRRNALILLLFLPFSLFYVPAFSAVSVCGFVAFFLRARDLRAGARAW